MTQTKVEYYEGRVGFLTQLLKGHLSAKQRRQAEQELMQANVRRLRALKQPREKFGPPSPPSQEGMT